MSKPVLFIPGYPGTDLRTRSGEKIFLSLPKLLKPSAKLLKQLEGPDDLEKEDPIVAGEPVKRLGRVILFDILKQAATLYAILERLGIEPVKFGYDWRRPIWDPGMQLRLEREVRELNRKSGKRIVAIVHSTGGLVLRYLLENKPALAPLFERVIAFGVPWAGLLKTLRYLDGQEGMLTIKKPQAQRIIAHSWAAIDLLPPDPARTSMSDAQGQPLNLVIDGRGQQTSPLVKRDWYPAGLRDEIELRAIEADRKLGAREPEMQLGGRVLRVTNVVGWGAETTVQATISGSGAGQRISDWKRITEPGDLDGGDATAPFRSASWLRGRHVTRYHLPVGYHLGAKRYPHSSLWRNPGGRNLLAHLLVDKKLETFVYAAVDTTDFERRGKSPVRVRISALDPEGQPLENVRIQATDLDPGQPEPRTFDLGQGRHKITLPRARMRLIQGDRFRRTNLRIGWDGGFVDRVAVVSELGG